MEVRQTETVGGTDVNCHKRSPFCRFYRPLTGRRWSEGLMPVRLFPTVNALGSGKGGNPFIKADYDAVYEADKSASMFEPGKAEPGWDKLKLMFTADMYGRPSPEWYWLLQGTYASVFAGALLGGLITAHDERLKFQKQNRATLFQTQMHARRALQDKMTLAMISGGAKYGIKVGAFSSIFMFNILVFSAMHSKANIFDFAGAGVISGVLWRLSMGIKAAVVSGGLGGVLGNITAGTGSNPEQKDSDSRDPLTKEHDNLVASRLGELQEAGAERNETAKA